MYRYYGEGSGPNRGYHVSFAFSVIPSSCELIVYDVRSGHAFSLENERFVVGDRSDDDPRGRAMPWAGHRWIDLSIMMERMHGPAHRPLARHRVSMEFRISWEPAFARVRWREGSPQILFSVKADAEEGGRWARPSSPRLDYRRFAGGRSNRSGPRQRRARDRQEIRRTRRRICRATPGAQRQTPTCRKASRRADSHCRVILEIRSLTRGAD